MELVSASKSGVARSAIIGDPELCGGCDPSCMVTRDAPTESDFGDPRFDNDGVAYDSARGGIVIGGGDPTSSTGRYAWISSYEANVVNKLNMETLTNDGVYRTGRVGEDADPSRTAVDGRGFVYVANRGYASVTKIAGDIEDCVEVNGIPGIQTSQGETSPGVFDLLGPYDSVDRDECIIWDTVINGGSGGPRAVAVDALHRLWVGLRDAREYWVLDTESGEILDGPINVDHAPYGAAITTHGTLWSASTSDEIQSISTVAEHPDDSHVGPVIDSPSGVYGIAVDNDGRVFVGGGNSVGRYTPSSGTWVTNVTDNAKGISIHADGRLYVAGSNSDVVLEHDTETLAEVQRWDVAEAPRGVAPGFDETIWAANMGSPDVGVVDLLTDTVTYINTFGNNYTYSDFTGYGFAMFAAPEGTFVRTYDGALACGMGNPIRRMTLYFDTECPETSGIFFFARAADTLVALTSAREVFLGYAPPDDHYFDLELAFEAEGLDSGARYFQVRVVLKRLGSAQSPLLQTMALEEYCG